MAKSIKQHIEFGSGSTQTLHNLDGGAKFLPSQTDDIRTSSYVTEKQAARAERAYVWDDLPYVVEPIRLTSEIRDDSSRSERIRAQGAMRNEDAMRSIMQISPYSSSTVDTKPFMPSVLQITAGGGLYSAPEAEVPYRGAVRTGDKSSLPPISSLIYYGDLGHAADPRADKLST